MKLIVVSNRLPTTIVDKSGKIEFKVSVGGLTSGLSSYFNSVKDSPFAKSGYIWVGWPGATVSDEKKEDIKSKIYSDYKCYPVFLSEKAMNKFYEGFCNKTIWPLFHYFPSYAVYDEDYWTYYKMVNEAFCDAIAEVIEPDDIVWVHDYHLMLLPKLLKDRFPNLSVGFFLHIPFPSFEIFRLLPNKWRKDILEGMLGADLIGFHTHDYTQYFLRCVMRILGHEHNMGQIITGKRLVKADTFPMGIDFQSFYNAVNTKEVKKEKEKLKKALGDLRVILSIDRLDYSKGILNRLKGYQHFLKENKEWHKRVVLVLVLVPSRTGVEKYRQMKRQIDELIGEINGKYSSINWTPIIYQYKSLNFYPLVALYSISDIAMITPLRDGMNLIAKEYVASRTEGTGVLILSEMAGASKELGEAIIINPNTNEDIANALKEALEMPEDEQMLRNNSMQCRIKRYDVAHWANDFINMLISIKKEQKNMFTKILGGFGIEQLIESYHKAKKRLILLDYDGTLVPFAMQPEMANPPAELLRILENLSSVPDNELVLISGRDKDTLQEWLGMLNIGISAEHGVWIKEKKKNWEMIKQVANEWKQQILPLLEIYSDRVPGSFIEEKEFSVVFHYRRSDPELSSTRAKELIDDLVHFTANIDVQVLQGNKVVEVRNLGIDKGAVGVHYLTKGIYDFILAIGDDWTDEDLFKVLPKEAYTIKVGIGSTHARFNLSSYKEVINLLELMAK